MNDDSDIPQEYMDYSKVPRRDFGLDDKDRQLYKELNKIRYRFDKGYISADKFFKEIDYPEFYGFLTEYEWTGLNKWTEEEKQRRITKDEETKRRNELRTKNWNEVKLFLIIVVVLIVTILAIIKT